MVERRVLIGRRCKRSSHKGVDKTNKRDEMCVLKDW